MQYEAGTIIAGRYQLDRRVGEGGMGVVWAATHLVTRKAMALKFLKGSSPEHTKRFLREARIAGMLGHPHIVQVHDLLELPEDGTPTMVMELLAGESLESRLRRLGPIALRDLVSLMLPVVSAVGSAHALGVVHRDLKPENIFLATSPHAGIDVKVLDFGIAKLTATEGDAASTSGLTQTGAVMGTPYYMAPEQVFGEKQMDHRTDVWALGVILYECLSGRRPIEGDNFGQIFKNVAMTDVVPIERLVPSVPPEVAALIARMLTRERDRRPSDLREVFAVLSAHADRAGLEAARPPRSFGPAQAMPPLVAAQGEVAHGVAAEAGGTAGTVTVEPSAASVAGGRPAGSKAPWVGLAVAVVALGSTGAWRYARSQPQAEMSAPVVVAAAAGPTAVAAADVPISDPAPAASPAPSSSTAVMPTASAEAAAKPRPALRKPATDKAPIDKPTDKKPLPGGVRADSPY